MRVAATVLLLFGAGYCASIGQHTGGNRGEHVVVGSQGYSAHESDHESLRRHETSESLKDSRREHESSIGAVSQGVLGGGIGGHQAYSHGIGVDLPIVGHVGISSGASAVGGLGGLFGGAAQAVGSRRDVAHDTEYSRHTASEAYDRDHASSVQGGSSFGQVDRYANHGGHHIIRRDIYSRDSERGSSLSAIGSHASKGASAINAGQGSRVSSSKASASESNRGTKIKTSTAFGAGQQSAANNMYAANQGSNYGGFGGFGGFGGIGGFNQGSAVSQHGASASQGYVAGNSQTEIEQVESNKQAQSETHEASQGSYVNGGSAFESAGQSAVQANQHAREGEYVAGSGGYGGYGGGRPSSVFASNKDFGASSSALSASQAQGASSINAGQGSRVASSKGSSSESNKATKIKTGTQFSGASANMNANAYDASQGVVGFGGFGVGQQGSSVMQAGQAASSGYVQGVSQSEIEQSESSKHSEQETHEAEQGSHLSAAGQYAQSGQQALANQQHESENVYAAQG